MQHYTWHSSNTEHFELRIAKLFKASKNNELIKTIDSDIVLATDGNIISLHDRKTALAKLTNRVNAIAKRIVDLKFPCQPERKCILLLMHDAPKFFASLLSYRNDFAATRLGYKDIDAIEDASMIFERFHSELFGIMPAVEIDYLINEFITINNKL